jgi:tetratricopeptide (TPR) repeat protein
VWPRNDSVGWRTHRRERLGSCTYSHGWSRRAIDHICGQPAWSHRSHWSDVGQQPKALTPEAGPAHLWGAELRAWRTSRGLALLDLGKLVHCSPSHLARMERAERPVPSTVAAACDRVLGAEGALIRLHRMSVDESRSTADVANSVAHVSNVTAHLAPTSPPYAPWVHDGDITVPVQVDGRVIYVQVPRRQFLQGLGAGLGLASLGALPLASPTTGSGSAAPIEHLRTMRATLADSDNIFGPRRVIPAVREQLEIITQLRASNRGKAFRDLASIQTEFSDLLSWLHQDLGEHQASQFWIDRALESSHTAGDGHSTAFILARKAQLSCDMGDGSTAIGVAEAALRMARPGSRVQAVAAIYGAHGYALLGDGEASARTYDIARTALDDLSTDEGCPYGQFIGVPYLQVHQARSRDVLGDHHVAADEITKAVDQLGDNWHRDAGVYLARAATAHARAGDVDHATTVALRALAIGHETGSGRALAELEDTNRALARWAKTPAVRQFRDAIATITTSGGPNAAR